MCNTVHAQITLTSAQYPLSLLGTDSLKVTEAASSFPTLTPAANGIWDLSSVTDSVPYQFVYRVASSPYQFADSDIYSVFGFSYVGDVYSSLSSSDLAEFGLKVNRTPYSLASYTSFVTDSFIIDAQSSLYSAQRTKIAFPATYSSSWSSAYSSDLKYHLYFLSAGYNDTPGYVRIYTNEKDTVVGWGRMRIKDASGMPSAYWDVLQVQTTIIHTDSFFMGNTTLPPALLVFFSLTEGQKDTTYEQSYYRIGEVTPLAQVEFRDAAFTQPYSAKTHVQRLVNVGVNTISGSADINAYPDPVTGNSLHIMLPSATGSCTYTVCNMAGQVVASGTIHPDAGNVASITLPDGIASGRMILNVLNANNIIASIPLEILH
jgi:hypothetical protein